MDERSYRILQIVLAVGTGAYLLARVGFDIPPGFFTFLGAVLACVGTIGALRK